MAQLVQLLFNQQDAGAAPDFTLFDAIEVSPVRRYAGDACGECDGSGVMADGEMESAEYLAPCTSCHGSRIEAGTDYCEVIHDLTEGNGALVDAAGRHVSETDGRAPDCWSVYGHYAHRHDSDCRGVICLTDCPTEELADAIGLLFRAMLS